MKQIAALKPLHLFLKSFKWNLLIAKDAPKIKIFSILSPARYEWFKELEIRLFIEVVEFTRQKQNWKQFHVFSCGAFGNFVTSASNFRQLFPGIRSKLCTLNFHFYVPLFRELALGWGMMSAKASSIKYALTQPNDKSAACNADGYTSNAVRFSLFFLRLLVIFITDRLGS